MVNMGAGFKGVIGTVVLILLECLLLPVALVFILIMNGTQMLTANDRTILASTSTIFVAMIIVTAVGGLIASAYLALTGKG